MPKADEPPVAVELKACPNPWCEALERDGDYSPAVRLHHFGTYRVVCTSCVLEGPLRPTQAEAIAAWNNRPAPQPVGREASEYISPDLAEVAGIVAAMHTKWMQREELMRQMGGFELMQRMADLMDGIVDAVPELSRKLQRTIAEAPSALSDPDEWEEGEPIPSFQSASALIRAICEVGPPSSIGISRSGNLNAIWRTDSTGLTVEGLASGRLAWATAEETADEIRHQSNSDSTLPELLAALGRA